MAVVANYVAEIGADPTMFNAVMADVQAKLSTLGANIQTTGLDSFATRAQTAVQGVGGSLDTLSVSFANAGQAAQAGFGQVAAAGANVPPILGNIGAAAASAGSAVESAGVTAAAGLNQISTNGSGASAVLGSVSTSAAAVSQTAGQMAGQITAAASSFVGLSQGAAGAAASVSDLALRKADLMVQLQNVGQALRSETSVMLGAQEAARSLGGSSTQLNQIYAESQTKVADLAVKQQLLKNELGSVSGALKVATTAQQATNAAQNVAGATTEALGQKTGILSALMSTHTSQISSQGTAWKGYDNVVQAAIRSMGGIPVVWALAITVAGVLLEKLIRLGDEKKKQIQLDYEQIQLDTQRWQSMNTGTLFTQQYATVLHDVNAINADVKRTTEELLVSRAEEWDAIRKSSTAAVDYAASTDDLKTKIIAYGIALFHTVETENEATAARLEKAKAQGAAVEMEIKAAVAAGKTIAQLIAERTQAGATALELGQLASAWGVAFAERSRYEQGRGALQQLKLEIAQSAAERGEIIKKAEAARVLTDAISKLPDAQQKLVKQSQLTEQSLSALNATTNAHTAAARAARPALDIFKDGLVGLTKATEDLIARASANALPDLFGAMASKARAGVQSTLAELKAVTTGINTFLSSQGIAAKLSESQVFSMLKAHQTALPQMSLEWDKNEEAVNQWSLKLFQITGATVPIINKYLESIGQAGTETAKQLFEGNQETVLSLAKAAVAFDSHAKAAEADRNAVMLNYAEVTKGALPLRDSASLFNLAAEGVLAHARALQASIPFLHDYTNSTIEMAKAIQTALSGDEVFQQAKKTVDAQAQIDASVKVTIATWEAYGKILGLTGAALTSFVVDSVNKMTVFGEAGRKGATDFQRYMDQISFDALQHKINSAVNGIVEIFTLIPGEFGKMAKGIESAIRTIDKVLGNLHQIFSQIPANLGGVITQVIGIFKSTAAQVQQSTAQMSTDMGQTATDWVGDLEKIDAASGAWSESVGAGMQGVVKQVQSGAAQAIAAASAMMAGIGLVITGHSQGGGMGAITGALGGALTGFAIGSNPALLAATWGVSAPLGAIIGGVAGLITGIFGGGKTALQKAQEAAQLQQAKDAIKISQQNVLKAVEETKQSMIETLDKARTLLETISFYSKVPKLSFQQFFHDVGKLFDNMLDLAARFSSKATEQVKAAAENLKPVVELVSMLPQALDGINAHLKVPDIQFDRFFADTKSLLERIGTLFDEVPKIILKHARKFQKALGDALKVIPDLTEALSGLFTIRDVSDVKLDIFESSLKKIVERLTSIADLTDKGLLKSVAFFADKIGPGIALWKDAIEAIGNMANVKAPNVGAFDIIASTIKTIVAKVTELAEQLSDEVLPHTASIATASASILTFWQQGIGALKDMVGIPAPSARDFDILFSAIRSVIDRMKTLASELTDVDAAEILSQSVGGIVSIWKESVGALKDMIGIGAPSPAQFDVIFDSVRTVIQRMAALADEIAVEAVAKAAELSQSSSVIASFWKSAVDAIVSMKDIPTLSSASFDTLFNGIKTLIDRLGLLAQDLSREGITEAATLASLTNVIFTAIKSAVDTLKAIAEAKWPDESAWSGFISAIDRAIAALAAGRDKILSGQSIAAQMAAAAKSIADDVASAASSLAAAASGMSGLSLSGTSALSLPSAGSFSNPTVPTSSSSTGSSRSTTTIREQPVVVVHVYGSLVHQARIEDVVVDAITRAQRRGRLKE